MSEMQYHSLCFIKNTSEQPSPDQRYSFFVFQIFGHKIRMTPLYVDASGTGTQ